MCAFLLSLCAPSLSLIKASVPPLFLAPETSERVHPLGRGGLLLVLPSGDPLSNAASVRRKPHSQLLRSSPGANLKWKFFVRLFLSSQWDQIEMSPVVIAKKEIIRRRLAVPRWFSYTSKHSVIRGTLQYMRVQKHFQHFGEWCRWKYYPGGVGKSDS